MSLSLRPATPADVLAYYGREPPADWCIENSVLGYVAERDGLLVGIGIVTWDCHGRAWGWFGNREPFSAVTMHRKALSIMGILRQVGEPVLHAICAKDIPGSDKWLRRLGFAPDPKLTEIAGEQVWSVRFADG